MALMKSDIQEVLAASEERLSQMLDSKLEDVEKRLKQEITSSTDTLEQKLGEKIASESKILQILFGHVLKNQEVLQAFLSERLAHIDHTTTSTTEDQQEICDELVELQSDVEQLKYRVFGVR